MMEAEGSSESSEDNASAGPLCPNPLCSETKLAKETSQLSKLLKPSSILPSECTFPSGECLCDILVTKCQKQVSYASGQGEGEEEEESVQVDEGDNEYSDMEWTFYPSSGNLTYHTGKKCIFEGVHLRTKTTSSERTLEMCIGKKKYGKTPEILYL
ncbi:hypothetical protein lerEdw1_018616 [Lerista edwardsae]|nr:hypothetical protein lerEdw1_018616 [Lerista edwardsae]